MFHPSLARFASAIYILSMINHNFRYFAYCNKNPHKYPPPPPILVMRYQWPGGYIHGSPWSPPLNEYGLVGGGGEGSPSTFPNRPYSAPNLPGMATTSWPTNPVWPSLDHDMGHPPPLSVNSYGAAHLPVVGLREIGDHSQIVHRLEMRKDLQFIRFIDGWFMIHNPSFMCHNRVDTLEQLQAEASFKIDSNISSLQTHVSHSPHGPSV